MKRAQAWYLSQARSLAFGPPVRGPGALRLLACQSSSCGNDQTGDYDITLQQHGGVKEFYETLASMNPDVSPLDFASLLQSACELQLRCSKVKQVISEEQISADEFRFVIEFAEEDGSTFS